MQQLSFFDLDLVPATGPIPIDDPYLDIAYMPTIGPSSIALLRHLGWLYHHEHRHQIPFDIAAAGTGLGSKRARGSLNRLVHHRLIDLSVPSQIGLPVAVPLLPASMSARLPVTNLSYIRQYESSLPAASPHRLELNHTSNHP